MTCSIDKCNRPARCKGMCAMHYMRWKRNGTVEYLQPLIKCSVDDCTAKTSGSSGLCTTHYKQRWYLNSVGREELIERTSQERWINIKSGYVMIKNEGKLTYEHRVLAEKALGKPLPPGAIVHHTGAPDDNHGPFKLVICPDQEYHMLIHKRMEELGYGPYNKDS